jgi:Ser/Thr protein kinase RdoA (MazF antagonist)
MEARIKERFSDDILRKALRCYGVTDNQVQLLDGFESFIYAFTDDTGEYILRISHSFRRSVAQIFGEADWINYLVDGGASASGAIFSMNGKLVEAIDDGHGGQFLATVFFKAPGTFADEIGWNTTLYEQYGRALGKMHALTKDYTPAKPEWKRPEWDSDGMLEIEAWLPDTESIAIDRYWKVKAQIDALPRDQQSYGLIHQDAHADNFFVDDAGNLTFFDFDDCVYGWFIYDIAVVLFYKAMWAEDRAAYTHEFMSHFLRGYAQENRLDPMWLQFIPQFLKVREIDQYAVIHRSYDVNHLENAWDAGYMKNRKTLIESDAPYIDFDFMTLADYLS